jgi:hypothetical protein
MVWLQLFLLNVVVFFFEMAAPNLTGYLALVPANALAMPWTFVTSIFLHANAMHLVFNMFALLVFAPLLEYKVGSNRFLQIYFLSGILGNTAFFLVNYGSPVAGLGASGAIYGVLGALAVLEPNLIVFVGFVPMTMWLAALFWVAAEFLSLGRADQISHSVHLVGIFVGMFYASSLRKRFREF